MASELNSPKVELSKDWEKLSPEEKRFMNELIHKISNHGTTANTETLMFEKIVSASANGFCQKI